jgi:enamine deaminase RidA (YjgF/YER057c/UK114 family)
MLKQQEPLTSVQDRLHELGIELPETAPAVAAYVPAIQTGLLIQTSGQLPLVGGTLKATGKVGDGVSDVSTAEAAVMGEQCVLNGLAAIKAIIGSLDRIERIVKITGFVASDPAFTKQHLVLNGASELLGAIFGDRGDHARSAVGVAVLPLDAPVEVELLVELKDTDRGHRTVAN